MKGVWGGTPPTSGKSICLSNALLATSFIYTTDVIVEQLEFAESKNPSGVGSDEEYAEVPEGFEGLPFK